MLNILHSMFSVAASPKSAFSGEPSAARGQTASTSTTQITEASTGTNSADWDISTHSFSHIFEIFANKDHCDRECRRLLYCMQI